MATLKEIAEESSVSIATVSNILNGKGNVSEETAKKVLKIAQKYNYVPNIYARNLKSQSLNIIGVITEDLTIFHTPEIVDGINYYCEKQGYSFVLGNMRLYKLYQDAYFFSDQYHKRVEGEISVMLSNQIKGFVYVGGHNRDIHCLPQNLPVPVVCAYCYTDTDGIPTVTVDDMQAGRMATEILLDAGCRQIGVIAGPATDPCTQDRLLGYQSAMYTRGLLFNPNYVRYGPWDSEFGYQAAKSLFDQGVRDFFTMSDLTAIGAMDYASEHGLTVGKDYSLIGVNANEVSGIYSTHFSTMSMPLFEIGSQAAEMLLNLVEKKEKSASVIKVPCTYIDRKSVVQRNNPQIRAL